MDATAHTRPSSIWLSALLSLLLVAVGCDSSGGMRDNDDGNDDTTQSTQVSGRVTDNSKSGADGTTSALEANPNAQAAAHILGTTEAL